MLFNAKQARELADRKDAATILANKILKEIKMAAEYGNYSVFYDSVDFDFTVDHQAVKKLQSMGYIARIHGATIIVQW